MSAKPVGCCKVTTRGNVVSIVTTPRRWTAIVLVLSGLTYREAGAELGISRERIRQYMHEAGLNGTNRLLYSARKAGRLLPGVALERRMAKTRERRKSRAMQALAWVREYHATHGRSPHYWEVLEAMTGRRVKATAVACPRLATWIGKRPTSRHYWYVIWAVYRLAGVPRPTQGGKRSRRGGLA